jgi:hypothetical protein
MHTARTTRLAVVTLLISVAALSFDVGRTTAAASCQTNHTVGIKGYTYP